MNLYINLFRESKEIEISSLVDSGDKNCFLNFQGAVYSHENIKSFDIEDFENYRNAYNQAAKNYTSFIAKLSKSTIDDTSIRSFSSNGLPIFWLTNISEKHYYHWLMKVMLLKELLLTNTKFFQEFSTIIFIVPDKYKEVESLIRKIITPFNPSLGFYTYKSTAGSSSNSVLLKTAMSTIMGFLKMKIPKDTVNSYEQVFLYRNSLSSYSQNAFNNIIDLTKKYTVLIPLFPWNSPGNYQYKTPLLFWKTQPSIFKVVDFFIDIYGLLRRLEKINVKDDLWIDELPFSKKILKEELKDVILHKSKFLLMSFWLSQYKKKTSKDVKYYYEDEFYSSGRAISFGLKGLCTHGVQHSMIGNNHSVYHILDDEINDCNTSKDGLPLPHRFVVWGDFFKNQFLKHNSLDKSFVIAAGNPSYIKRASNREVRKEKNEEVNILYCLTTQDVFQKEVKLIQDAFSKNSNLKLIIRFHPAWKFEERIVLDCLSKAQLNFDYEDNIFEAINKARIIVSSAHSGIWLDAIVANKPVIKIITAYYDEIEQNDLVYGVSNYKEMNDALKSILAGEIESNVNSLLYLKPDKWENFN